MAIGVTAVVGVPIGDGIAVANLNGGKVREMPDHGSRPCPPPLAVVVPLRKDTCYALVDEPHHSMAHLVGQRAHNLTLVSRILVLSWILITCLAG